MAQFGEVAVEAIKLILNGSVTDPCAAWEQAASKQGLTASLQEKGCPKEAFLGLCSAGLVKGIPHGTYTDSLKNAL